MLIESGSFSRATGHSNSAIDDQLYKLFMNCLFIQMEVYVSYINFAVCALSEGFIHQAEYYRARTKLEMCEIV